MRLTKKGFVEWLLKQNPQDIVVELETRSWSCPLEIYLEDVTNVPYLVGPTAYHKFHSERDIDMPKWAQKFVEWADNQLWRTLTVEQCLIFLKGK